MSFLLENQLSSNQSLGVKVATPVGNLVGQVLFGWLADIIGRKRMCKSNFMSELTPIINPRSHRWRRANDHDYRDIWSGSRW